MALSSARAKRTVPNDLGEVLIPRREEPRQGFERSEDWVWRREREQSGGVLKWWEGDKWVPIEREAIGAGIEETEKI